MTDNEPRRIDDVFRYAPGPHSVIVVWPVCVLVELPMSNAVVQQLHSALVDAPTLDTAIDILAAGGVTHMPSFGIMTPQAAGLRLVVRGDTVANLSSGERVASKGLFTDTTVAESTGIALVAGGESPDGESWPIRDGIVAAGRVTLHWSGVKASPPARQAEEAAPEAKGRRAKAADTGPAPAVAQAMAAPAPEPKPGSLGATQAAPMDDDEPAEADKHFIASFDWSGQPTQDIPPAPLEDEITGHTVKRKNLAPVNEMVPAVRCLFGHLNPPHATYCRVCPSPIPPQEPFEVVRPPLGMLHMANGLDLPLDRGAVLGRNPHEVSGAPGPQPNLVRLNDANKDISSQHLEVRLEGWFVTVTDLRSTNGTQVILPGQPPITLRPDEPMTIEPGTRVILADVFEFLFEASQ